jgi:hypothetical protein
MTHHPTACRTAAVGAAAILAALATALSAAERGESWDAYRILVDRNIFVRNRRPPMPDRPEPRTTYVRPPSAPRFVLTGTARSGDGFIAFFEDYRSGSTRRASVGKELGGALVKAITLNGVVVEDDGTSRTIRIGCDLSGEEVALARPATRTTTTAPPAPPAAPAESDRTDRDDRRDGPDDERAASDRPEGPPRENEAPGEQASPPEEAEAPGGADDADTADILERMRRRREEELRR